jgi:hypothetical protein
MKLNLIRRGDLRKIFVDSLVVLVGVLAALLLNNLREDAAANRAARVATERLVQEVEQNAEGLRNAEKVVTRRLALLRELRTEIPAGKSLGDFITQFHGFWVVDLNTSAWEYLSRSALADFVDPALLHDAFALYSVNKGFDQQNEQIQNFVYSELFVSAEKASTGIDVSEAIMWQQLKWAEETLPKYEEFLSRYSPETRARTVETPSE